MIRTLPVLVLSRYLLSRLSLHRYRKMSNFKIYVRDVAQEDTMRITFMYGNSLFTDRNFIFIRSKEELLEVAIARVKTKIQNLVVNRLCKQKKKKQKTDTDELEVPSLNITLIKEGNALDPQVKNAEAWTSGTRVKINDRTYDVIVNPPAVLHLSLPNHMMSGFPVYPRISLEFCTKEESIFKWYKSLTQISNGSANNLNINNWQLIAENFFYITCDTDIGYNLKLSCLPKHEDVTGIEEAVISRCVVQPGPGKCPFEDRHEYTKDITKPGSMRFLSYNILADLYADSDTARNELFPYCPHDALSLDYRKQLYIKEIIGYNADIICLQEVDRKVFHDDLIPVLSTTGLQGIYNEKGGQVAEGLSCFYRISKFKVIDSNSIILSDAVKTEPVLKKLHLKIVENEKLAERFMNRTTALQTLLLESLDVPGKRVLVGNTHLYFHPESDNIRLLQAACCLLYLEMLLQKYRNEDPSYSTCLILSGDFNSCPEFGVYNLATSGFLSGDCVDWKSNPEEIIAGMDLSHSLSLSSACGTPKYTNYTEGFVGCLDYIFYDKMLLKTDDIIPFPTHEQVTKYKALPNKVFPSDHIALACNLSWKEEDIK